MKTAAAPLLSLVLAACTTTSANPAVTDRDGARPPDVAAVPSGDGATGQPPTPTEPPSGADTTPAPTEPPSGADTTPAPTEAPTTSAPTPSLAVPDGDEWRIVFVDDFNRDELGEVWNTCYWWQTDGGCTIASNDEQQWYRPEGVSLGEGDLRLRATADPQRTTDGDELPFRSGMVTTGPASDADEASSFSFTYGEVSVRAMVPAGEGAWPAVWLLSADKTSLPEIDIFEWYGSRPDTLTSHVHNRVDDERRKQRVETAVADFAGEWHVFTVTWLPDRVVFALDGVETGRVTDPALVPSTPMYLIANLAMGGEAGRVDPDALPLTLRIDEIVVSQWVGS